MKREAIEEAKEKDPKVDIVHKKQEEDKATAEVVARQLMAEEEAVANNKSEVAEAEVFGIVTETVPTVARVASRTDPKEAAEEKYDAGRSDPEDEMYPGEEA